MSRMIILVLLYLLSAVSFGQEPDSRILNSERMMIIKSVDEILIKETSRTFVARKSDIHLGFKSCRETDFVRLISMDAVINDLQGNVLKELDEDDIQQSTVSYSSIYNEHNTIYHQLSYPVVPYIIENKIEYEVSSTFFLNDWDPQHDVPVDHARLEIVFEYPLEIRYRCFGGTKAPAISTDQVGYEHYIWEQRDIAKYKSEYRRAPEAMFQTGVKFQVINFDLGGFAGGAKSWHDFGDWAYRLFEDNMSFSPGSGCGREFLTIADRRERIAGIYRYLQENTRYVQIYLGIDGWRPHPVDEIHRAKYGDCKDLSVYMLALLKEAGIEGYPGLVLTRDKGITDKNAPGNNFNHCIAIVPLESDTLFLECTSDATTIYDIPPDIEDIDILLVAPDQSRLIRTPGSIPAMNRSCLKVRAVLNDDRSLDISGEVFFSGNLAISLRSVFEGMKVQQRRDWIIRKISQKSADVVLQSFEIDGLADPGALLHVKFDAKIKFFASKAGSRLIFEPELFHQIEFEGEKPEERKMALLNHTVYSQSDSIVYTFPESYRLKNGIMADSIRTSFGYYSRNITTDDRQMIWSSRFDLGVRKVSPEEYPDYYDFMEKCRHTSKPKLILMKN